MENSETSSISNETYAISYTYGTGNNEVYAWAERSGSVYLKANGETVEILEDNIAKALDIPFAENAFASLAQKLVDGGCCTEGARIYGLLIANGRGDIADEFSLAAEDMTYRFKVEISVDYRFGESWSKYECDIEISGKDDPEIRLKRREYGSANAWAGDGGNCDRVPEVDTLCEEAKDAVDNYLSDKDSAWWRRMLAKAASVPVDLDCNGFDCPLPDPHNDDICVSAEVVLVEIY